MLGLKLIQNFGKVLLISSNNLVEVMLVAIVGQQCFEIANIHGIRV